MTTSADVYRFLIENEFAAGGAASGPYGSSIDATRAAILVGQGCPRRQGTGQVLAQWEGRIGPGTTDLFTEIVETPSVKGNWTTLEIEPEVDFRPPRTPIVGNVYAYDAVSKGPYGVIRTGLDLPIGSGGRDGGFFSQNTVTKNSNSPGVNGTFWSPADAYTWAARLKTSGTAAGQSYQIDFNPNFADWGGTPRGGIAFKTNNASAQFEIRANDGTVNRASVTGLSPAVEYIVVAGYERTTPGGGTVNLKCRVYDTAGVFIAENSITRSGYPPSLMPAQENVIHDCGWFNTYADVLLSDAQMDAVAANPATALPGSLTRRMTGLKTGVLDRANPGRFIIRWGSGLAPVANWRPSRY